MRGGGGEKLAERESVTVAVRAERHGVAQAFVSCLPGRGIRISGFWHRMLLDQVRLQSRVPTDMLSCPSHCVGRPADIGLSISRETCRNIIGCPGDEQRCRRVACQRDACGQGRPVRCRSRFMGGRVPDGLPLAAHGQCAVTALVIQDYLGGDLLRAEVSGISLLDVVPGRGIRSDASSSVTSSRWEQLRVLAGMWGKGRDGPWRVAGAAMQPGERQAPARRRAASASL
jgi:hypothetical protein